MDRQCDGCGRRPYAYRDKLEKFGGLHLCPECIRNYQKAKGDTEEEKVRNQLNVGVET